MYRQSFRGTFASSTKYLRQSSWPYVAAFPRSRASNHQISFFLRRNISRCPRDHRMLLALPLLFRLSRRFHFVEKKSKTVEVSSCSSLSTRLFFITRATIREAVLQHLEITFICCHSNRPFIPLALFHFSRPLEQLEFVRSSNFLAKPGLIYHSSSLIFLSPGHVIPHQFQRRNG